ncbi:MAG: hypothetical protein Q4F41_17300 [Eubacteriales bacterium]|nr:hypothetical protein [Eubacteriales bacterium]
MYGLASILGIRGARDKPEDRYRGSAYSFNMFSIYRMLPELIKLWGLNVQTDAEAKKTPPTEREMTTPLFLLRCVQLGICFFERVLIDRAAFFCYTWGQRKAGSAFGKSGFVRLNEHIFYEE